MKVQLGAIDDDLQPIADVVIEIGNQLFMTAPAAQLARGLQTPQEEIEAQTRNHPQQRVIEQPPQPVQARKL